MNDADKKKLAAYIVDTIQNEAATEDAKEMLVFLWYIIYVRRKNRII